MQENGTLHTIDIKEELVDFQRKHLTNPFGKTNCTASREATEIIPKFGH
jgi:hypothetical protein